MAPSQPAWLPDTRQYLESRQVNWRDSFISRARRIGMTQKVQIWKKHFAEFISKIIIKKGQNRKKNLISTATKKMRPWRAPVEKEA
jgi:hypothetical protein